MKILSIKIENLNSFYGKHYINLEDKFKGTSLFLIMGPTGAGKSTITDAICLALFGETPRLTNKDAQIVSKGCHSALAELEFSKGKLKYKATWQINKGKKAKNFGYAMRTLAQYNTTTCTYEDIVANDKAKIYTNEFNKVLENMELKDFKRMVLLPQGEFANFLKATEAERINILERLTNSDNYKKIGKKAFEQYKEIKEQLREQEIELGQIKFLDDETIDIKNIELKNKTSELNQIQDKENLLLDNKKWLEYNIQLNEQLQKIKGELNNTSIELEKNKLQFTQLENYEKHKNNIEAYENIEIIKRNKFIEEQNIEINKQKLQNIITNINKLIIEDTNNEIKLTEKNKEIENLKPLINEAKEIITTGKNLKTELDKTEAYVNKLKIEEKHKSEEFSTKEEIINQQQKKADLYDKQLEEINKRQCNLSNFNIFNTRAVLYISKNEEMLKLAKEINKLENDKKNIVSEENNNSQQIIRLTNELNQLSPNFNIDEENKIKQLNEQKNLFMKQKSEFELFTIKYQNIQDKKNDYDIKSNKQITLLNEINSLIQKLKVDENEFDKHKKILIQLQQQQELYKWELNIAEQRKNLSMDKECPLCGSFHHPFANKDKGEENRLKMEEEFNLIKEQIKNQETFNTELQISKTEIETTIKHNQKIYKMVKNELIELKIVYTKLEQDINLEIGNKYQNINFNEEIQKITNLIIIEEQIEKLKTNLHKLYVEKNNLEAKKQMHYIAINNLQNKHNDTKLEANKLEQDIINLSANYKKTDILKNLKTCIQELNTEIEELEKTKQNIIKYNDNLKTEKHNLQLLKTQLDNQKSLISDNKIKLKQQNIEINEIREKLLNLNIPSEYKKNPEELEKKLHNELLNIQKEIKNISAEINNDKIEQSKLESDIKNKEDFCLKQKQELNNKEELLFKLLQEYNIDIKILLSYKLNNNEYLNIQTHKNTLAKELNNLQTLFTSKQIELNTHNQTKTSNIINNNLIELNIEIATNKDLLSTCQKELILLANELKQNSEIKKTYGEKKLKYDLFQQEAEIWKKMNDLIGKNEGLEFQKFVQILNLEKLIIKANVHLKELNNRYALITTKEEDNKPTLSFSVKDFHQAEQVRPINTLSGGETFLVSLALALALSEYRTIKMPIETLLIDEGFGALDPNSLNIAIRALEKLGLNGTQVGLISHVTALQDYIPAKINIIPIGNGHSKIEIGL